MSKILARVFAPLFLWCVAASALPAGISIDVTSLGSVDNLVVGRTTTILVVLAGLEGGRELNTLAAVVVYDGMLLGQPSISPGPIVPNVNAFFVDEEPGMADATFLTFGTASSDHIVSNGTFFSFDVIPLAPGKGSLALDLVDATEFSAHNPGHPIPLDPEAGPAMAFTAVVPEPIGSTWIMLLAVGSYMRRAIGRLRR